MGHRRICVVTSECIGPLPSGGIGTAMTGLAEALAEAGHEVTVLFTRGYNVTARALRPWQRLYRERGMHLQPLPRRLLATTAGPLRDAGLVVPSAVLQWLGQRRFDVVQLNDTDGDGVLALAAHRFGALLPEARFMVAVHSPREWVHELNREPALLPVDVPMRTAERLSVAAADVLWSPSAYLLQWLRDHGWALPRESVVQPYLMPRLQATAASRPPGPHAGAAPLRAVVFFGRLEERKGLRLFLDAIDTIADELAARDVEVVFLGKPVLIGGQPSEAFIARRARHWPLRWRLLTDRDQADALAFLREPGRLAVMASPADNSPCTVYESLEAGIPFLAASTGGIPELIHEQDWPRALFEPEPAALAAALRVTIERGPRPVRPALDRAAVRERWLALVEASAKPLAQPAKTGVERMVVAFEDEAASRGFAAQRAALPGERREALVGAFLTDDPEAAPVPAGVLPIARRDAGRRLLELCATTGDSTALVLVHRSVTLEPGALARLWQALERDDTDAVLPSARSPAERLDACGAPAAWAFLHGPAPTGCIALGPAAIAAARQREASEDAGPFGALADRAIVGGARVWPLPELLVRLHGRRPPAPVATTGRLALYAQAPTEARRDLVLLAATATARQQARAATRRLRLRLIASPVGGLVAMAMGARRHLPGRLRRWIG